MLGWSTLLLLLPAVVLCEPVVFARVHPLAGGDRDYPDQEDGGRGEEAVEGVPGGWHGRNLLPSDYDPMVECTLAAKPNFSRYLYCPGNSRPGTENRIYCCGDENAKICCTAEEWRAEQANKIPHQQYQEESGWNPEDNVGDYDESSGGWQPGELFIQDDLPGWAIALIVLGSLVLVALVTYLICCCCCQLFCYCCCGKKKKHEEEKTVLIHNNYHHHHHSSSWPPATSYNSNGTMLPATAPVEESQLYYNATQKQAPPPSYEQQRLYPVL